MLTAETVLQGRYRILRQLGKGGMGAVYEALDSRLDTTIALKETLFADDRLRRQFEREARLLARLHHPALPRVSDHFSEGDGQFLVMQFIAGDDLEAMLTHKGGPFPPDQVLTWADQLLDALDYLHTQNPQIVHRDIKPQNLKLTARGQIILLDFGLAKGQSGDISRGQTAASIFGYTPNYAPLEQIQGLGTDPRSDLYALAATLYHLLTGVKPPDALTRAAAHVNGQADPLLPANEANSGVTPEVDAVLRKALAQNRDLRYASAVEMRRALMGTAQAATVTNRGEANTVLLPTAGTDSPAATRAVVKQDTVSAGETTIVRHPKEATKRLAWPLAAVAVFVLAIGAWGFMALQRRSKPASGVSPNAVGAAENPAIVAPPVAAPSLVESKPAGDTKQQAGSDQRPARSEQVVLKKTEKDARRKAKPKIPVNPQEDPEAPRAVGHGTDRTPPDPDEPNIPDVRAPGRGRPGRIVAGGTIIRNFPDGHQVITTPDGTRILVTPDGQRQVLGPGRKPPRRRIPPNP